MIQFDITFYSEESKKKYNFHRMAKWYQVRFLSLELGASYAQRKAKRVIDQIISKRKRSLQKTLKELPELVIDKIICHDLDQSLYIICIPDIIKNHWEHNGIGYTVGCSYFLALPMNQMIYLFSVNKNGNHYAAYHLKLDDYTRIKIKEMLLDPEPLQLLDYHESYLRGASYHYHF